MKTKYFVILLLIGFSILTSCKNNSDGSLTEEEIKEIDLIGYWYGKKEATDNTGSLSSSFHLFLHENKTAGVMTGIDIPGLEGGLQERNWNEEYIDLVDDKGENYKKRGIVITNPYNGNQTRFFINDYGKLEGLGEDSEFILSKSSK